MMNLGNPTDYYTITEIYKYHLEHPKNQILTEIINHSMENVFYTNGFLHSCYKRIISSHMGNIIYEIISFNSNSFDEVAICQLAIDQNRFDIIDYLATNNFNFNQMIFEDHNRIQVKYDILTYALEKNNFSMIKYLVGLGAEPWENNLLALNRSSDLSTFEFFDYFMDLNIPHGLLQKIFLNICKRRGILRTRMLKKLLIRDLILLIIQMTLLILLGISFQQKCNFY